MDSTSGNTTLPIQAVDRLIGSYAGGMNTESYYYAEYVGQPKQQTPTNYIEVNEDGIPIVYINGSQVPATETVTKPGLTPQERSNAPQQKTQTSAGNGSAQFEVLTPSGFATTLINAVFSIAVTIAIIMGIVVTYLIIRTKQLHHHEEHVRAVAPGHGHDETHAADTHHEESHEAEQHHGPDDESEVKPHDQYEHQTPGEHSTLYQGEVHPQHPPEYPGVTLLDESDISGEKQPSERGDTSLSDVSNRYAAIKTYVAGEDPISWRHALMDIDLVLEDLLARKGLEGSSTAERLAHADSRHLSMVHEALDARAYYEQLVAGTVPITQETMQKLLELYKPILTELGL